MNNTLTIRTAFSIVILSIFSAFLAGGLVMGIATSFPDSSKKIYTYISFFIGQGFMLVPLGYFLISQQQPILKILRLRKVSRHIIVNTFLFGSGILILSDELDRLIQVFIPAPDYIVNMSSLMHPETVAGFIVFILAVVMVAPFGEEILFRGFLQQFLEKHWKDSTKAVLITSLFFAMIHLNPYWMIQIYFLGLILGFLAWRTESVVPSLILHGLNNAMAIILSFSIGESNSLYTWNGHVSPWILLLAIGLIFFGFKGINQRKV
ncbi:MAG: type II CAAX endopeptidase family protein [Candidatus Neomarinimicrobiota bacterium]|nr:type II CAAX endopeptidase family protein [Candidatus Neomarinimicrobiota bacterium]